MARGAATKGRQSRAVSQKDRARMILSPSSRASGTAAISTRAVQASCHTESGSSAMGRMA